MNLFEISKALAEKGYPQQGGRDQLYFDQKLDLVWLKNTKNPRKELVRVADVGGLLEALGTSFEELTFFEVTRSWSSKAWNGHEFICGRGESAIEALANLYLKLHEKS